MSNSIIYQNKTDETRTAGPSVAGPCEIRHAIDIDQLKVWAISSYTVISMCVALREISFQLTGEPGGPGKPGSPCKQNRKINQ